MDHDLLRSFRNSWAGCVHDKYQAISIHAASGLAIWPDDDGDESRTTASTWLAAARRGRRCRVARPPAEMRCGRKRLGETRARDQEDDCEEIHPAADPAVDRWWKLVDPAVDRGRGSSTTKTRCGRRTTTMAECNPTGTRWLVHG